MLKDLQLNWDGRHISDTFYNRGIENANGDKEFLDFLEYKLSDVAAHIDKGVFEYYDYNTDCMLIHLDIKFDEHLYCVEKNNEYFSLYGVCDNYKQILEKYNWLENDNDKYVIGLCKVIKTEQPKKGGWRWHKWGDYIGTHEITQEYIADEENIDFVYCFNIHKIID